MCATAATKPTDLAAAFKREFGTRLLKQLEKLKEMMPEGKKDMIDKITPPVTAVAPTSTASASDHKKKCRGPSCALAEDHRV